MDTANSKRLYLNKKKTYKAYRRELKGELNPPKKKKSTK